MSKKLINKSIENLILITAFLFGLHLFYKTSLLCFILVLLSVFRLIKINSGKVRVSRYGLCISATLITYTLISYSHGGELTRVLLLYTILPLFSYLAGYSIIKNKNLKFHNKFIFCTAFGFFVFGVLNIYKRYIAGYNNLWWIAGGRMCLNYWTGEKMWPTLAATYFLPIASLVFYSLVINKNKPLKAVCFAAFIVTAWAASDIGSRTIVVVPVAMCLVFLFLYYGNSRIMQSKKIALLLKILTITAAAVILYQNNTAGLKTTVESSNLYSRLTGKAYDDVNNLLAVNGREDRYFVVITEMPTHLFGGIDLGGDVSAGGMGTAHNTWLDIYRVAGVIPFVLFILCTAMLIKRIKYLITAYSLFSNYIMPLISVLIIINLQFLTESMFTLNSPMLNYYFMLCGMADCMYVTLKNEQLDSDLIYKPELNEG